MARNRKSKNRKGRPRKPDVKRTESGQISRAGKGPQRSTPQSEAWRRALVNHGNPAHADYPLGRLYAEGAIGDRIFRAGCRYAWVHACLHGKPILAAAAYGQPLSVGMKELSPDEKARLTEEQDAFVVALGGTYTREKYVVDELIVREVVPRWMAAAFPMWADVWDGQLVERALGLLAGSYEAESKGAKAVDFRQRNVARLKKDLAQHERAKLGGALLT